jgi:hypothetical protein
MLEIGMMRIVNSSRALVTGLHRIGLVDAFVKISLQFNSIRLLEFNESSEFAKLISNKESKSK